MQWLVVALSTLRHNYFALPIENRDLFHAMYNAYL